MFEYAKGRLKNRFFPKKCPSDVSLRPPLEKRQYLKIPEIDFFQILGSICFRLSKVRNANRVLEDGPILGSRPAKTCHAWASPRMKYQLYLPKATLEAVSDRSVKKEKNCSTLQGLKSMVYFRHLKVAKKSIFFRGWRNVKGQNPYPQTSKGRFLGKIDLWVFPNIKCKAK